MIPVLPPGSPAARLRRPLPLSPSASRTTVRAQHTATARRSGRAAVVVAVLVAAALPASAGAATALPSAGTAAAVSTAGAPVPRLDWQACGAGFECSTARVPLDYRAPHGATIDVAVIKHPATDPAHRIGSLFYNPGGPGVPGTQALPAVLTLFPEQVRARFDLVSFDPRGIGASTLTRCFADGTAEQKFLADVPTGFPVGPQEEQTWTDAYARLGQECLRTNPDLLPHLSTANVARDMDLLRRAVGDAQLTYYGTSYGSYLGATYANLFPGQVRSMVLDSAMDPVAWSTGRGGQADRLGSFLRVGTDVAAERTLNAFLDQCGEAGPQACAFSAGDAAATRAKFATLLQRLRQRPAVLGHPPLTATFTYASTLESTQFQLYTAVALPGGLASGWAGLAGQLQQLWTASAGAASATPAPAAAPAAADSGAGAGEGDGAAPAVVSEPYQGQEQALGVMCADSANPRAASGYPAQAALAEARSGGIGRYFAWATEPCATWPVTDPDRYDGPWNRPTAHSVLVVANTGDPAWPYQGSRVMSQSLAHARLLTVDGYGHTVLTNPSSCAVAHEVDYLVDGTLPPPGTVCRPDQQPFAAAH
ncbi:alpha/beta hydrolase [Kitasatospora sp. NBC_01250]|uniref:alpha/beta hydrolase n=1 Tax=Kitasatospora sp. NBC_01250 TaxID=2903571 RepID=UPI002E2F129A|nr:alpha/beta hydrolase [Kitasatospora sp. NBC_01250]